jgi:hypothetical protein
MERPTPFSGEDVDLLVAVLSVNDSMLDAAHGVRAVESTLDYPIRSIDDLRIVEERFADRNGEVQIGSRRITLEQAKRYLGGMTFPVEDREQLVSRLVNAFEAERLEVIAALSQDQGQRQLGRNELEKNDALNA